MNCYNGEKYLREAIDSIYAQSYENWEIIFWDNCSTDNSANIAKSYDDRIKYYYGKRNIPLGAARNKAIKHANGNYITFLDCDDLYIENTLQLLVNKIENTGYAFCYGGVNQIDVNGIIIKKVIPKNKDGFSLPYLLEHFNINVPSCIIDKSFLNEHKLNFDEKFIASEEYNLFMKIAAISKGMGVINSVISNYRVYQDSLTNKSMQYWAKERTETLKYLLTSNPDYETKYIKPFKTAFARSAYYKARWLREKGQKLIAIKMILPIIRTDIRYILIALIMIFPDKIYSLVLRTYYSR